MHSGVAEGSQHNHISEDSSHQAENDKYSKSGFVLDTSICRLELQLSLVAMVFAHSETGSSVGRQIIKKKKKRSEYIMLNYHQLCENGPFGAIVQNKFIVYFSSSIKAIFIPQEDKFQ